MQTGFSELTQKSREKENRNFKIIAFYSKSGLETATLTAFRTRQWRAMERGRCLGRRRIASRRTFHAPYNAPRADNRMANRRKAGCECGILTIHVVGDENLSFKVGNLKGKECLCDICDGKKRRKWRIEPQLCDSAG